MTRLAAWAASLGLLVLGIMSLLTSASLLRPATNPISITALRFQADVIVGTVIAGLLLLLSEVAARRWSAPVGGWRWAWFLIGALFLVLGTPLLLGALAGGTPLHRRTVGFRLGMGGIYVMLGFAAIRAGVAGLRARSKARFDSLLRGG